MVEVCTMNAELPATTDLEDRRKQMEKRRKALERIVELLQYRTAPIRTIHAILANRPRYLVNQQNRPGR